MSKLYGVTIYVIVSDEDALIKKARQEVQAHPDDQVDAAEALRWLLDNGEALEGAEIDDSKCEYLGEVP